MLSRAPLLCAFLLGIVSIRAQTPSDPPLDLYAARAEFKKGSRSASLEERKKGLDALVASRDPRALEDLLKTLEDIHRDLGRLGSKIEATGKKLGPVWRSIDKQGAKGLPVTVGSATGAQRKHTAIAKELDQLADEQTGIEAYEDAVLRAGARLLMALPEAEQTGRILDLSKTVSGLKPQDGLAPVRLLQGTPSPRALEALMGLAESLASYEIRSVVVEALGSTGEPKAVPALAKALSDEAWPVRVAAARGLGRLPSLDGVPPLVGAIDAAEGRVLEEILLALEDLTGRTFHDNATLWRDWWKENSTGLQSTMKALAGAPSVEGTAALEALRQQSLLAAARLLLQKGGLRPSTPKASIGSPATEGDSPPLPKEQLEAIGSTISLAPQKIRDRALSELILGPLVREGNVPRRAAYLAALGPLKDPVARKFLFAHADKRDLDDPDRRAVYDKDDRRRLRLAAVDALSKSDHAESALVLGDLIDTPDPDVEVAVRAIAALRSLRLKVGMESLIRGLGSSSSQIKEAAHEALVALAGTDHGTQYTPWRDWWRTAAATFKAAEAVDKTTAAEDGPKRGTTFYGIETKSRHIVYILDVSGSMNEVDSAGTSSRIAIARTELIDSVRSLQDGATFNILVYNHEFTAWKKQMIEADKTQRAAAIQWIEEVQASGNTNIFDPLEHALELAGRGAQERGRTSPVDTIFFLSDGQPNRGRLINPVQILKELTRLNETKKVKIHTVGIGKGHDAAFMSELARITNGMYVSR